MRYITLFSLLLTIAWCGPTRRDDISSSYPTVLDSTQNLTYIGVYQSGVEAFLGIQYGQDTGGQNRFKPPVAYNYTPGAKVAAQTNGPACPQPTGAIFAPLYLGNITEVSEDCLLLNVNRPNATTRSSKLPVMVFIHGGSFFGGSKDETTTQPGGLIAESLQNGHPVMYVAMNYRLASFGFAQSAALLAEGSTNAGLRDQRLALDWVKNNIAAFGGDPENVTIFGQSSGGLAVGIQIMAYGGSKPAPFQRAICESQSLEGGITGNFTRNAMSRLVNAVGCNTTDLQSNATVACLRNLTTQQMLTAQDMTHSNNPSANLGDEWLPVVDGDILPEAPSVLINQGKFANITTIIGWCDTDAAILTPFTISTANDTDQLLRAAFPGMNDTSIQTLESLYPISDFAPNLVANLSAEFYRSARIIRDYVFTCNGLFYGQALAARGNNVYLYDQNQTLLNPIISSLGLPDLGVVHTSEFAYVFGNLSHYDINDYPYHPNPTDHALLQRQSRSWSSFAALGNPSIPNATTLQNWTSAFNADPTNPSIFVIGGTHEGSSPATNGTNPALDAQNLQTRCTFLNSPAIIQQLAY